MITKFYPIILAKMHPPTENRLQMFPDAEAFNI